MSPVRDTQQYKQRLRPKEKSSRSSGKVYIYGTHALKEALVSAPQAVRKVFLSQEQQSGVELRSLLKQHAVPIIELARGRGNDLVGREAVHQGVIALIDPSSLLVPFDVFLDALVISKNLAVVVLGEVQDPHNVGAIIRSAAAFGIAGVLIPEHNQARITGAVVKASAGMAFRIPLVPIGNVNRALEALKKKGFWTYGLAADGNTALAMELFDAPTAFVVGNEGRGIREKTLAACDVSLSIPMHERSESLNAAAAAAVVFYAWSAKHPEVLA